MDTPSCPGCQQRDQTIADLRQRLADSQARVRDLEDQLDRNATNSSPPPSANPDVHLETASSLNSAGRSQGHRAFFARMPSAADSRSRRTAASASISPEPGLNAELMTS
jgi:hypothetical protein